MRRARAWLIWFGCCVWRAVRWLLSTDSRYWTAFGVALAICGLVGLYFQGQDLGDAQGRIRTQQTQLLEQQSDLRAAQRALRDQQTNRDADRVEAGAQRCTLIRHIIAVPDAAGAPPRLTAGLRSDLRKCEKTLADYRKQAGP